MNQQPEAIVQPLEAHLSTRTLPVIGIVLVNYNGGNYLPACLQSLTAVAYPSVKIVLVDNASTDGSADWVAAHYPNVHLIRLAENTGITGGNEAGITWCLAQQCDYVLLLNNDTEVDSHFLTHLVAAAEPDTIVVPKILYHDDPKRINNHFGDFDYWRGVHRDFFYNHLDDTHTSQIVYGKMTSTCATLFPSELLKRIGAYDAAYFIYYDDTDLITRAVRLGAKVKFVPQAVVYHKESSTSGGKMSPLTVYYCTRNRLYFMRKHQQNPAALVFFFIYFFITRLPWGVLRLIKGERRQIRAMMNGVVDFLKGRMGKAPKERYDP
ncbi:predicted glycosyltransferase [Chthonomonas calidirosea]|uniref:Predicted glycosyltransferases n=1 Tax=Chthonomonas calidirosea (strain DSM 23976 / ICMP 18418 / T49) TaxID=1303518 RepID=S0EYL0_CHTCT|nr:glycosyltransferase family 2 protein [Chthonomonas calidirosea]CCW35488.1 Predicted glycosyltransferases [Chthonomonas calidirosea T49]CEK19129.1 predicted glycosyltransferase [Chthonomonas calidirosea]CEK20123.1 predicted glycosyltransferase [Chthonomonas calidirosea]